GLILIRLSHRRRRSDAAWARLRVSYLRRHEDKRRNQYEGSKSLHGKDSSRREVGREKRRGEDSNVITWEQASGARRLGRAALKKDKPRMNADSANNKDQKIR